MEHELIFKYNISLLYIILWILTEFQKLKGVLFHFQVYNV